MPAKQVIEQFNDLEQLLYIVEFCNDPDLKEIQSMSYEEILDMYNNIYFS